MGFYPLEKCFLLVREPAECFEFPGRKPFYEMALTAF